MLFTGLITLTYYLSKAYNKQECPKNINQDEYKLDKYKQDTPDLNDVFSMRPTEIYNTMFSKPSIWQGYESISVNKNK